MAYSEEKLLIAVQGTRGAYSHLAAENMFPNGTFLYFKNFSAVARAVRENMCTYGVLPLENNTYGSVKAVYKVLKDYDISIVHAYRKRIDHVLLGVKGSSLSDIKTVISHEQAIGQCENFLHNLGNRVKIEACLNTAVAARTVAESGDEGVAAISSPECAGIYGLEIIKRHIADSEHNYTRFICVADSGSSREVTEDANRISMLLTLPHVPGSLADVLDRFAARNINLLKIESAPVPGRDFEFMFFIDIEAKLCDPEVGRILRELKEICPMFVLFGNYREDSELATNLRHL